MGEASTGRPSQLAFFLVPGFSMMAFASAVEPLRVANRLAARPLYAWRILSRDGQPVAASNGMLVVANARLDEAGDAVRIAVCAGFEPQHHYDRTVSTQL